MAIICNLKSQSLPREYSVIDAYNGYAMVALVAPAGSENTAAFEVEVDEITNVRVIDTDGLVTEYPDHLRVERRYHDRDDQSDYRYPGVLM